MKNRISLLVALLLLPSMALSLPIIATPTDTVGPLRHNVFHDGGTNSSNGAILAWFDLNTAASNNYDPATGALEIHITLFSDSSLTNPVGTAIGTSSDLTGFGDFDNSILGSILWSFDIDAQGELGVAAALTMQFIDRNYAANSSGDIANSYVGNTATLWGADGVHDGNGLFTGTTLGVDMSFVVPEPSILMLMAFGLLGFGLVVRKR